VRRRTFIWPAALSCCRIRASSGPGLDDLARTFCLYDHLGGRKLLPKSRRLDLSRDPSLARRSSRNSGRLSSIPIAGSTTHASWSSICAPAPRREGATHPDAQRRWSAARREKRRVGARRNCGNQTGVVSPRLGARHRQLRPVHGVEQVLRRNGRTERRPSCSARQGQPTSWCRKFWDGAARPICFRMTIAGSFSSIPIRATSA